MIAEYNEIGNKDKIDRASMVTSPITVKDIVLLPFVSNIRGEKSIMASETSPMLKKVDERKYNAYLSTPRFIKYLTDISELISKEQDKKAALKRELRKLNQSLPAAVYIPFCQDSIRNYAVLHIPPEEVAVFQTKTRAPFMCTVEMYRPDELSMLSGPVRSSTKKSGLSKTGGKRARKESLDVTSDYEEPLIAEQTDDIFNMQRGKSNSVYMNIPTNNRIDITADKKVSNPLFISFIGKRPDTRDTLKQTMLNKNKVEKQVKKFLLDSDEENSLKERTESDQSEENKEYKQLSQKQESSEDNDEEYLTIPDPSDSSKKPKLVKARTGDPMLRITNDGSVNRSESLRRNSDDSKYYTKNDLNEVLSQRKEEDISMYRDKRSGSKTIKTPTNFLFKETFEQTSERLRKASIFGSLKTWKIIKIIVKSGDDLRQEQFAMQLIDSMSQIFKVCEVGCWLKPYEILATDDGCGIMVCLKDAMSIDAIKKKLPSGMSTLKDYFLYNFGGQRNTLYKRARLNFCKSLAGYSLVCYLLQVKDRHNGNIMLDNDGHIIHIDFGFLLSIAPGKGLKFEKAPFKFTTEYLEVLGGIQSKVFKQFKKYMAQGFTALQKNADKIIVLVEMMAMGQLDLPCFAGGLEQIVKDLKHRLFPTGQIMSKQRCRDFIDDLVYQSQDNWRTVMYDRIQYCCQGIN